jgi:hypothetical protein
VEEFLLLSFPDVEIGIAHGRVYIMTFLMGLL